VTYRILGVREEASVKEGSLYPELNSSLLPIFGGKEEVLLEMHVAGLSVLEFDKGKLKQVTGATSIEGDLWVTSHRVVVRCVNYDKVKWTGENQINAALYGAGTELAFHAASKLYHRAKSHGKALVGNLFNIWLEAVLYRDGQGHRHDPSIRLMVPKLLTDGTEVRMILEVGFARDTDVTGIAQLIVDRAARAKYNYYKPDQGMTRQLMTLSKTALSPASPERYTERTLPIAGYVNGNQLTKSSQIHSS
jgi:hypothetical protein